MAYACVNKVLISNTFVFNLPDHAKQPSISQLTYPDQQHTAHHNTHTSPLHYPPPHLLIHTSKPIHPTINTHSPLHKMLHPTLPPTPHPTTVFSFTPIEVSGSSMESNFYFQVWRAYDHGASQGYWMILVWCRKLPFMNITSWSWMTNSVSMMIKVLSVTFAFYVRIWIFQMTCWYPS